MFLCCFYFQPYGNLCYICMRIYKCMHTNGCVCICVSVHICYKCAPWLCVCVCVHMCACMRSTEVDIEFLPQSFSTLCFKTRFSPNLGSTCSARLGGQQVLGILPSFSFLHILSTRIMCDVTMPGVLQRCWRVEFLGLHSKHVIH